MGMRAVSPGYGNEIDCGWRESNFPWTDGTGIGVGE